MSNAAQPGARRRMKCARCKATTMHELKSAMFSADSWTCVECGTKREKYTTGNGTGVSGFSQNDDKVRSRKKKDSSW